MPGRLYPALARANDAYAMSMKSPTANAWPFALVAGLVACLAVACSSSDSPMSPTSPSGPSVAFAAVDLVAGAGPGAAPGQVLTVAFTGWLFENGAVDGKGAQFDQSDRFSFTLGDPSLIPGWNRGIEGMQVGGRRRIIVPPELGFGSSGVPGRIPPDAALVFEVELLAIS